MSISYPTVVLWENKCQDVVKDSPARESPWELTENQSPGPHSRPPESESLGGTQGSLSNLILRRFLCSTWATEALTQGWLYVCPSLETSHGLLSIYLCLFAVGPWILSSQESKSFHTVLVLNLQADMYRSLGENAGLCDVYSPSMSLTAFVQTLGSELKVYCYGFRHLTPRNP